MLATILRTEVAEEVSIRIMDAFVMIRRYISSNLIGDEDVCNMLIEKVNKVVI